MSRSDEIFCCGVSFSPNKDRTKLGNSIDIQDAGDIMNQEDFAIVVGISNYPGLGDSPGDANLKAPDLDAREVYDWLISEDGGAIPDANVELITSVEFPQATSAIDAEPALATIEKCFKRYIERAEENAQAGAGRRVGRRLYVYVSGHGFSPKRYEGALYTAAATKRLPEHIYMSDWIEGLQDVGLFDQFVLWMDCCMEREFTVIPQSLSLRLQGVFQAPGPTFIALAAPRPLKTVEREISADGDRVRGVFTWTLLKGLQGAAIDDRDGAITGRSLGDYLRNAMKDYLNPKDLDNQDIAKEPEIVKDDPRLMFRSPSAPPSSALELAFVEAIDRAVTVRGDAATDREPIFKSIEVAAERPTYAVELLFPDEAIGKLARLWTEVEVREIDITTDRIELNLDRRLYAIEVADVNLRQGFEVTGSGTTTIEINTQGERAIAPATGATSFLLNIDTGEPTAEIFIIDRFFALAARGIGSLRVNQPFGVYKIKIRIGRDTTEQIVLLDRDTIKSKYDLKLPQLASAAPLAGSALIHEYHEAAARGMSASIDLSIGSGGQLSDRDILGNDNITSQSHTSNSRRDLGKSSGQLSLMVRSWGNPERERGVLPWQGIEVLDAAGTIIANLEIDGRHDPDLPDPLAICNIELDPGTYYVRRRLEADRVVEQSAIVSPGWRTELFLLRSLSGGKLESQDSHRLSVFMHRLGSERQHDRRDLTIEAARIALADGRHILTAEMKQMFLDKCDNPISGIIGAYLLLMEYERTKHADPQFKLDILNFVVPRLRDLVGEDHPDVEALSLRCLDVNLHTKQPFRSPPMFAASWESIVRASADRPELISLKLWDKVRANVDFSVYFAWASDRGSRRSNKQQLTAWIESLQRGCPLEIPTADTTARGGTRAKGIAEFSDIKSRLFDRFSGLRVPANALEKLWHDRR